jgi:hypothetical protein
MMNENLWTDGGYTSATYNIENYCGGMSSIPIRIRHFSSILIGIRIHKASESGSNAIPYLD